ncbi:MAG: STT3 domain-containing protein, partial [Candidatus Hecatellaceae archaeon]
MAGRSQTGILPKIAEILSRKSSTAGILTATVIIAFLIRLLPLKWGQYLAGMEPYWYYHVAEHLVKEGFQWVFQPQGWVEKLSGYPEGRDVASTTFLGLPFTALLFHSLLASFGFNLQTTTIMLPAVLAALTVLAIFFLGAEAGGDRRIGLLAALIFAFCPAYVVRSAVGCFEPASAGILALTLLSLFIIKAFKAEVWRRSLVYAFLAGLALAYLNITWEACYFAGLLLLGFLLTSIIAGKYSSRQTSAYLVTLAVGTILTLPFPQPGLTILLSAGGLPNLLGIIFAVSHEGFRRLRLSEALAASLALTLLAVSGLTFHFSGLTSTLASEAWAAVNPAFRESTLEGMLREASLDFRPGT